MNFLVILICYEIVPIILWALGWYFENNASKYPDTSKGYKSKIAMKDEKSWVFANKAAGKLFGIIGTVLFFAVALGMLVFDIGPIMMAFIIFITICVTLMVIEGLIRKKNKEK